MKRIFASFLAVVMIVACFAVTSFAATAEDSWTNELKIEGSILTFTVNILYTSEWDETTEAIFQSEWTYPSDKLTYKGFDIKAGDTSITPSQSADYSTPGTISAGHGGLTIPMNGAVVEFKVEYYFDVLAAAGETIEFKDNSAMYMTENYFWTCPEGYMTTSIEVPSEEPQKPTLTAVASGTQVRTSPEMADVRIKFDLDKTAADFANFESGVINVTINNGTESKTVPVVCNNTFANTDTTVTYTVVITGIPAAAWGWTISADFVATFSNGTTTGSAAATTVTALVDAAA